MNQDTDPLTGLYNMVSFYEKAAVFMKEAEKAATQKVTFVYFDIMNFKFYNEQFGFNQGDMLLRRVGKEIREAFPLQSRSGFHGAGKEASPL